MTGNRQKSAWIWLAVAAIAVVTLARAEAGLPKGAAFTNPVLEFLSAHAGSGAFAALPGNHDLGSVRSHRSSYRTGVGATGAGMWAALLPMFFIGLIAPLNLISARAAHSLGITPQAPVLSSLFQRPP